MKILVTGANGLLGKQLVPLLLQQTTATVIATGRSYDASLYSSHERYTYHVLDITDGVSATEFCLQQMPDIIIHAAAMTNVDECEEHKVDCWNTNVTATRFLLDAAKKFQPYFIFLSTDFVFDGLNGPYNEDDMTGPVNYYGSSKVAAEKAVMESGLSSAIVRTCLVYGDVFTNPRPTIITRVKESLAANKSIQVVADQWRTPTFVDDLAKGILLLVQQRPDGIFNLAGRESLTLYDMAVQAAGYFKWDSSLILKAGRDNFTQPALRPARAGLVIDKAVTQLGYDPLSFTGSLKAFAVK